MTTLYLGEFEQVVLLAVLRLGDGAYAIPVGDVIAARTGWTWPAVRSTPRSSGSSRSAT